ncbi:MAG: hypothetical protein N3A38_00200 [Planctomycetota bacterium]|nr:hypothetical protein [Planctomycetota bacterium]
MKLQILHHVYTSVSGYRTQYASPGAERALPFLEDLAQRIYPRVSGRPIRGLARVNPEDGTHAVGMAFFYAFPYQTDAYGRPRVCVHTIFVPPETVRRHPFLNLLPAMESAAGSPFMGPKRAIETVAGFLPGYAECPDEAPQYSAAVAAANHPNGQGRIFLRALISGTITTVTLGQPDIVLKTLSDLWPLLPPRVRHRFAYIRPFSRDVNLGPFGSPKLMLAGYAAEAPDPADLEAEGYVVFDMARRRVTENLPAENAYVAWLMEKTAAGDGCLPRVLRFLEAKDPLAETAYFALNHLGQAVRRLAPILDEDGTPVPARDPGAAADALVPLCRAGMVEVAGEIVDALAAFAGKSASIPRHAAEVLRTARKALEKYGPEMERFLLPIREVFGPSAQRDDITRLALPAVTRKDRTRRGSGEAGQDRPE